MEQQQSYASPQTVPLGGLSVGLPLSRMMMKMFGGDFLLGDKSGVSGMHVAVMSPPLVALLQYVFSRILT